MNKFFMVVGLTLNLMACAVYKEPSATEKTSDRENNSVENQEQYSGIEGAVQKKKDQDKLIRQANKVKCQDARLDLVDAEAARDFNAINRVKARLAKLCIADE